MQIRNLFLFVCLLTATFLQANPKPLFGPENPTPTAAEFACNLPAPTNFHVVAWAAQWVHLAWDLTNPNHAHRINVYTCDEEPILIKTLLVDAGITETTIFFLQPGIYKFEIKAVCTSGESPNSAWTGCIDITNTGLILDLVVTGFTPEEGMGDCTLPAGDGGHLNNYARCYFTNSELSTFRIRQTNWITNKENFGIERIIDLEDEGVPHFKLDPLEFNIEDPEDPDPQDYKFYVDGFDPDSTGSEYAIKQYGRVVAKFIADVHEETGESFLQRVFIADGYEIIRISAFVSGTEPGNRSERADKVATTNQDATATPNPFTDQLEIYPSNSAAESITLQLFNLSGQKVLDQRFPGGQEQYSLSTEKLSPGFYMLRIEADGAVQTLKVVKSE